MATKTELERNPLKPLSIPMAIRAAVAAILAISILLESAAGIMNGFAGSSSIAFLAALVLLAFAILDGSLAFRTGLRLPARSLEPRGIGATYAPDEIEALMLSGVSPNDKYLSWVGRWAARASDRFFRLPAPYQRVVEVALTAIAFGAIVLVLVPLLRVFGAAGGRPEVADAVLSWLFAGIVLLVYAYWLAMLKNIYSAADWGRKLSTGRIINTIGALLAGIALMAFVTHFLGMEVALAPSLQPWSTIAVVGTVVIAGGILVLAWLRSDGPDAQLERSRIQLSDSAAVHPQSIMDAFKSILAQTKPFGIYSKVGDLAVSLDEQRSTSGGTFVALAAGEYGAVLQQVGSSKPVRNFAVMFGVLGILTGAIGYVMLWRAAHEPILDHWWTSFALLLFGSLALLVANFPLSETLWKSWLMGIRVEGSYQSRGAMMVASSGHNPGYGSILVDYSLDGGIAGAYSVSYLAAAMVKADAARVLTSAEEDDAERETILRALRAHLARASGGAP